MPASFKGQRVTAVGAPTTAGDAINMSSAGREALALADYTKLAPWFAALARRNTARADVVILGASTTEGFPTTSFDKTLGQRLVNTLRARLPTPGLTGGGRGFIGPPTTAVQAAGGWPMTFVGGVLDDGAFHLGAKHSVYYNNGAAVATVTLASPITSFNIKHNVGPVGNTPVGAEWRVDGGSWTGFSTYAATATETVLTVNTPATTSVEVRWSTAGYFILGGITEFNGDESKGIQVHNCGHSGYTMAQWATEPASTPEDWLLSLGNLTPKLIIIPDSGPNDGSTGGGNVSAATYKTNLLAFIAKLRARSITCPILLAAMWDTTYGLTKVDPWSAYVDAMRQIAAADSTVVFWDATSRIPAATNTGAYSSGGAMPLFHTDNVHTDTAGDALMMYADTLAEAILPR